jgi:hypothetical protein
LYLLNKTIMIKKILISFSLLTCQYGFTQNLPIDFEGSSVVTSDFFDFDGAGAIVLGNPSVSGINTSATVAQIRRNGGQVWAGSKIVLDNDLDLSVMTKLTMKVYTAAPVGTVVKLKLEGSGSPVDADAFTTVSGEWESLEWIFLTTPTGLNELVFMFDFGNVGDGSATSIFYFDDIEQAMGPPPPVPAVLPIDFEGGIVVSSDILGFGGAGTSVIANPEISGINTSNTVCEIVRDGGVFWAGSYVTLADNLDLSTNWIISMKVYTSAPVGTRIKIELQGPDDKAELDYLTTVSGEWETATWNFHGQSGNFNRIVFIFDFGNVGDGSATSTFLFDDLEQVSGPVIPNPVLASLPVSFEEESVVSTDFTNQFGGFASVIANPQINAGNTSATVGQFVRSGGSGAPWAQSKLGLTQIMDFSSLSSITMNVYTEAPVGTVMKLAVRGSASGAGNEKDVPTTVSGEWRTYSWDFAGDPSIYDEIVLMLGYGTPNDGSSNAIYLFDDIRQTNPNPLEINDHQLSRTEEVKCFPVPAIDKVTFASEKEVIETIHVFDLFGKQVAALVVNSFYTIIDVSHYPSGVYTAVIMTKTRTSNLKIVRQ